MRIDLSGNLRPALIIWIILTIGILIGSVLYASLSFVGVTQSNAISFAFVLFIGIVLIALPKVARHQNLNPNRDIDEEFHFLVPHMIATALSSVLGSRFDNYTKLTTTFVSSILTKYHVSGGEYLAFEFRPEGIPTEHAGSLIYYVDPTRLFGGQSYKELDALCTLMAKDIKRRHIPFDFLVGLPYVGSHIGVLVAYKLNKPYSIFGKERETTVVNAPIDLFEGYIPNPGEKALLFDDAIVSGKSVMDAAEKLRSVGLTSDYAYAFLDKQHGGEELLNAQGIQVSSLIKGKELSEVLMSLNILTPDQVESVFQEAEQAKRHRLKQS